MALVNIAELFYQAGLRVLMVDWDLEAPGLEKFFFQEGSDNIYRTPGIMDLIINYKKQMKCEILDFSDDEAPFKKPKEILIDIYPDKDKDKHSSKGNLYLLTSGRRKDGPEYAKTILEFDWSEFYYDWEGELYFEWLRQQLNEIADIIFIDSRTGVTEMGSICSYQLADVVVMFCSTNYQSLIGLKEMIRNLKRPEVVSRRGRPLEVLVVPSRVDENAETDQVNEFKDTFLEYFVNDVPELFEDNPEQIWDLRIPYIPYYSFKETVATHEVNPRSETLVNSYKALSKSLSRFSQFPGIFDDPIEVISLAIARKMQLLQSDSISELLVLVYERQDSELCNDDLLKSPYINELIEQKLLILTNKRLSFPPLIMHLKQPAIFIKVVGILGKLNLINPRSMKLYKDVLGNLSSIEIPDEAFSDLIEIPTQFEEVILLKAANKEIIKNLLNSAINQTINDDDKNYLKYMYHLTQDDDSLQLAVEKAKEAIKQLYCFSDFYLGIFKYAIVQSFYLRKVDYALEILDVFKENGGDKIWYLLKKGLICTYMGDHQEASELFNAAYFCSKSDNNSKMEATSLYYLGIHDRIKGNYRDAEKKYVEAVNIFIKMDDEYHEAMVRSSLGIIKRLQENYEDAIYNYQRSLDIYNKIEDNYRSACVLGRMGTAFRNIKCFDKAFSSYSESLRIFREVNDMTRVGFVLKELGTYYFMQGEWDNALASYKESLEIIDNLGSAQLPDKSRKGKILYNAGITYILKQDWKSAINSLQDAKDIFLEIKDLYNIRECLNALGTIHRMRDNYLLSLMMYEEALRIPIDDSEKTACLLGKIGNVYRMMHEYDKSIIFLNKSLLKIECLNETSSIIKTRRGWLLGEIGTVLLKQNKIEDATKYLNEALVIFRDTGEITKISWALELLGQALVSQQLYSHAIDIYKESLKTLKIKGSIKRGAEIEPFMDYAEVFSLEGKYDKAIQKYHEALKEIKKRGDLALESKTLQHLGYAYYKLGHHDEKNFQFSMQCLRASLKIARDIGDKNLIAKTIGIIGLVYRDQKFFSRSITHLKASIRFFQKLCDKFNENWGYDHLGAAYLIKKDWKNAIFAFEKSISLNAKSAYSHLSLAICYKNLEFNDRYCKHLDIAENLLQGEGISDYDLACLEVARQNYEKAFELLEKALIKDDSIKYIFLNDPHLEWIRNEDRYNKLVINYIPLESQEIDRGGEPIF